MKILALTIHYLSMRAVHNISHFELILNIFSFAVAFVVRFFFFFFITIQLPIVDQKTG